MRRTSINKMPYGSKREARSARRIQSIHTETNDMLFLFSIKMYTKNNEQMKNRTILCYKPEYHHNEMDEWGRFGVPPPLSSSVFMSVSETGQMTKKKKSENIFTENKVLNCKIVAVCHSCTYT